MKNFARAMRLSFKRKYTFTFAAVCALFVAFFWGANISAVYPFMEVAFQGDSLQTWANKGIEKADQAVAEQQALFDKRQAELEATPATQNSQRKMLTADIHRISSRIEAEQRAAAVFRFIKPYIDHYVPSDAFAALALVILLVLIGTAIKNLFLVGNTVLVSRLAQTAAFDIRTKFYRRTLQLDLASFNKSGSADLMSRFTNDLNCLTDGLNVIFGKLIREPLKMVACLVGAALISWRLLIFSLIVAPVAGLLIGWLAKAIKRANRRAMEEMAVIYTRLEETFQAIKIVKAFTAETHEQRRFHRTSETYYYKSMRIAWYDSFAKPITEIMGIITICLALLSGAWLVLSNETHLLGIKMCDRPFTFATLILFYGFLVGAADPMRKMSDIFTRIQRASAAADRIYECLDRRPSIRTPKNPSEIETSRPDLRFAGVSFSYQPGKSTLQDITLDIPYGETVVLVGPNGCGKSTLLNLIPRFYDPSDGRVLLAGQPLTRLRLRDLRRMISLVSQETYLFNDTVMSNIRYGSPSASPEDVIQAARKAMAHDMIEIDLPDGYDTIVGPRGGRLSGGQRQRIALARAILRDPAILLLDEATSQIDLQSEQMIHEALDKFVRDRTAVIVTHRLAILALADRVVVMHEGRILDQGTHEELLSRCEWYRQQNQIEFGRQKKGDDSAGPAYAA